MERIKKLNIYQRGILIFMMASSLIFAVIYYTTTSRIGYKYNDAILVPTEENGDIVYSGKIQDKQAKFIVTDNSRVEFYYGDKLYGPYTVKEDSSAIPEEHEASNSMVGIEIREGDNLLFRGAVVDLNGFYWFYDEDGSSSSIMSGFSYMTSDGVERDENGNPIDIMKPSISTIYELIQTPELTHKGVDIAWFGAVFLCFLNALSILFADELFRFNLSFQIRNVEHAEPSDWEISERYIGWTVIAIMALVLFVVGLQ